MYHEVIQKYGKVIWYDIDFRQASGEFVSAPITVHSYHFILHYVLLYSEVRMKLTTLHSYLLLLLCCF